ncbi:MAG: 4-alpha-glucanotransferase, partial [Longimicrobiales bacterium]
MSKRDTQALVSLARLYGVEASYVDIGNVRQTASPETLLRTLQALGAPLDAVADARDVLRARTSELNVDSIEPIIVAWSGRLASIPLRLGGAAAGRPIRYTLRCENGDVRNGNAVAEPLTRRASRPGAHTHRIRIGGSIPLGYHDIEVETATGTLTARIISSPRRAWVPQEQSSWGVFLPLYALRGQNDAGVGSYTDLAELARWTAARGGAFVGTLPLLASFFDVCFEPSPYVPVSRLFWNELFIDVTRAPGWTSDLASAFAQDV